MQKGYKEFNENISLTWLVAPQHVTIKSKLDVSSKATFVLPCQLNVEHLDMHAST